MKTTLIVSTYNRPEAIRVVLDSMRYQTIKPDEIIIGDDGSTEEVQKKIREMIADFPIPVTYLWQEDEGFRVGKMRNKCVAKAKYEYIIEIDGDIMLHRKFVEDHLRFAEPKVYLKGGRVNMNKKATEKICKRGTFRKIYPWTPGIEAKRENCLHLKGLSKYLADRYRKHKSPGLGSNTSFYKSDFMAINGYDEYFIGWGGEDYDLAYRLINYGCKKRYLKFAGIVYHLWHEDKFMQNKDENFSYMRQRNEQRAIRCELGVDQYLE